MSVPLETPWGDRRHRPRGPWPTLQAQWRDLLLLSWPVDERAVAAWLQPPLVPDCWGGSAWVSLVGLRFTDLRVGALPMGPLGDFLEVNLRTYVRHPQLGPGVCFWRELVPYPWIAWTARGLWGEPYQTARVVRSGPSWTPTWAVPGAGVRGEANFVSASSSVARPEGGTLARWLVDRYIGFRPRRGGHLGAFRVRHSPWLVREGVGTAHWPGVPAGWAPPPGEVLALWSPGSRVMISPPFVASGR